MGFRSQADPSPIQQKAAPCPSQAVIEHHSVAEGGSSASARIDRWALLGVSCFRWRRLPTFCPLWPEVADPGLLALVALIFSAIPVALQLVLLETIASLSFVPQEQPGSAGKETEELGMIIQGDSTNWCGRHAVQSFG